MILGKAIGIDFGTTNTVVSYWDKNNKLRALKYDNSFLIPSAIYFKSKDDYFIGNRARGLMLTKPEAGVTNFKSHLRDKFRYDVTADNGDKFKLLPRVAVELFLNKVIGNISDRLIRDFGVVDGTIERAVITVPAKFNNLETLSIKYAALKAMSMQKLDNIRLVFEPTAAAVAAQYYDKDDTSTILVYDFGGGTFDVSVLKKERGKHRQIETDGDKKLGGNDLTEIVARELLRRINDEYGTELPFDEEEFDEDYHELEHSKYIANMINIRNAADALKIELSDTDEETADINLDISNDEAVIYEASMTRDELEDLIRDKIDVTAEITDRVLHKPAVEALGRIDKIVLAGGSSMIPMIRHVLEEKLNRPVTRSNDVAKLISFGATILSQEIDEVAAGTQQVTSTQIGVAATEGVVFNKFQMIVPEDTPLPFENTRDFYLYQDGQTALKIAYYEYDVKNYPESKSVIDPGITEIDVINIDNLPPNLRKDDTVVHVTFSVKADGNIDFKASVTNRRGEQIGSGALRITQESDLI